MNLGARGGKQFEPGNKLGRKFQPGQSGNPTGLSKARRAFEEALVDALTGADPAARAAELATIVWAAAKKGDSWAVQLLVTRFLPAEPFKVEMEVSPGRDELDFSRLSDEQIEQLESILANAGVQPAALASGESAAASS